MLRVVGVLIVMAKHLVDDRPHNVVLKAAALEHAHEASAGDVWLEL